MYSILRSSYFYRIWALWALLYKLFKFLANILKQIKSYEGWVKRFISLKRNRNLIIKEAGKGDGLVLMNKLYSKKKRKKKEKEKKWFFNIQMVQKLMMEWEFNTQTIKKGKSWCVSYNSVDILPIFIVTFKSRKIAWDPDIFYFSTSYLG